MITLNDINNLPKGLLLIFLAISGNFLAQTLGCRFQELMNNNMLAKYIFILFIIYFTVNYTSTSGTSPTKLLLLTILVWFFFILLARTNIYFTIIIFILLITLYTINNYIDYYKNLIEKETDENIKAKYNKLINNLQKAYLGIEISTVSLLVIGFIVYFIQKYIEYKGKPEGFKFSTFIFGKVACRGSND